MRIDWRHFRYVIFWRKTNHNLFTACKKLPNSTRQEGKLRGKRLTFSPRILAIRMATRFLSTVFDKNYIWYRRASRSWKQIMQLQDNPVRTKTEIKKLIRFLSAPLRSGSVPAFWAGDPGSIPALAEQHTYVDDLPKVKWDRALQRSGANISSPPHSFLPLNLYVGC